MKKFDITRFFAPLVAAAAVLYPAAHLFAESDIGKRAHMISILDLSPPPLLPRPEVVDENGDPIFWSFATDTSNLLIYNQDPFFVAEEGVVPILDPSGKQVNLRDWMQARGEATARCLRRGTQYKFEFKGLIPNGVYTIWHFLDSGQGALATTSFTEVDNVFKVSKSGTANLTVLAEPGPMSFFGEMPACSLTQSSHELFVVLYHIDNQYCGPFPCNSPDKKSVEVAHLFFKR